MNKTQKTINFSAEFEPADGSLKAVSGIAYGGGEVTQPWAEHPIVIDTKGMKIAQQIPLMYNHCNDPEKRLGEITATVKDGKVFIFGGIDTNTEHGKAIVELGKNIHWQLSIGAQIKNIGITESDSKFFCNGKEFSGVHYIVTESLLREVSVVAIGADAETDLTIAAALNLNNNQGETQMAEETKEEIVNEEKPVTETPAEKADETPVAPVAAEGETEEEEETKNETENPKQGEEEMAEIKQAVEEERERVACAMSELKDAPADVLDKAIKAGWTSEMIKETAATIKSVKAGMGVGGNIIMKQEHPVDGNVIEASIAMRLGMSGDTVAQTYGHEVAECAFKNRGMSAMDYVRASLKNAGHSTGFNAHEDIVAGFQVGDFAKTLSNVANKALLKSFLNQPVAATKVCSIGELPDYKSTYRVRLSDGTGLAEVKNGEEVPNTKINEEYAEVKVNRYAEMFWIDEQNLINDDLGAFARMPQIMGAKAAAFLDKTLFGIINANGNWNDGKALFHADHKNLLATGTKLSLASLKAAIGAMFKQTDASGSPVMITPKYLVVPTCLYAEALDIVKSQYIVDGTGKSPAANFAITSFGLEVVASPFLDATSTTAWYLFADQGLNDTFELDFLKGQSTPVVEQGQYDLSRFGIGYRCRYDFGIAPLDFRGIYKNPGAN